MTTIETIYLGDLRTEMTHVSSGDKVITDAPLDNNGLGQTFSPTDLVVGALGSCIVTLMGMAANTHKIDINDTKLSITKIMASNPRRIGEIKIDITFPSDYTDKEKKILEHTGRTCPVALSLHPDLKQNIKFHYPQEE